MWNMTGKAIKFGVMVYDHLLIAIIVYLVGKQIKKIFIIKIK